MSFLTSPRSRTARSIARYDWPLYHIRQRSYKQVRQPRSSQANHHHRPSVVWNNEMTCLLLGKLFHSHGSNFLKSHTFTKMTPRFSSQSLPRWRKFFLPPKKIARVVIIAGGTVATACGGIIYWSSGTIDSNKML